ncbi:DUF3102 domain-containing protein [Plectonema cf. radiosum LEGE 06105]|uniref:DUF3102 domain-containing protein n=2 Tax=Plectonema TaxID=1183 RepID=A0A8J7F7D8_9CYAN|nr:DUF3102 domain-containing protein [Plectonema cf. radiosum LEGE 06105]
MQRTGEIQERLQRSAQDIWEIGQRLADVRAQLKHGQFDAWLKAEFGWSRRTAYNFINVYETFGERANLAQIDIATSALYLLAAPSTPQNVREEYLLKAKEGEKITHKELRSHIEQKKHKSTLQTEHKDYTPVNETKLSISSASIPEIIRLVPQEVVEVESVEVSQAQSKQPNFASDTKVEAGWYVLEGQHLVFCGDTASSQFHSHIPDITLAVAATSSNWDHDWLIDVAGTLIVLQESALQQDNLEQLINMFSQPGDTIVFPWLPYSQMIAIANKLNRKAIAGDMSVQKCQQAISASGLDFASVKL